MRRFDASLRPAPGVVLGGNSGSFIGHVDEQAEIVNGRGMAHVDRDLFAVSGLGGVLHLVQWSAADSRFTPVRRIGAVQSCDALALDGEGRVWFSSGNWEWGDGPATPLRNGIPPGAVFGAAVLESGVMVAYGKIYDKPGFYHGKLDTEVKRYREEKPSNLPDKAVAVAAAEVGKRPAVLILTEDGRVTAARVAADGKYEGDAGPVELVTAEPARRWTSLCAAGKDALVGAADGQVIEFARDGAADRWRETRRWNSWGKGESEKFGDTLYVAADPGPTGRLWACDTARHRVLSFDPATRRPVAAYGTADTPGDGPAALNSPRTLTARAGRAVVFDSGNQRLVRLELRAEPAAAGN